MHARPWSDSEWRREDGSDSENGGQGGKGRRKRQRCHFMLWPPSFPFRSIRVGRSLRSFRLLQWCISHLEAHVRTNRPSEHFVLGEYSFLPLIFGESSSLVALKFHYCTSTKPWRIKEAVRLPRKSVSPFKSRLHLFPIFQSDRPNLSLSLLSPLATPVENDGRCVMQESRAIHPPVSRNDDAHCILFIYA